MKNVVSVTIYLINGLYKSTATTRRRSIGAAGGECVVTPNGSPQLYNDESGARAEVKLFSGEPRRLSCRTVAALSNRDRFANDIRDSRSPGTSRSDQKKFTGVPVSIVFGLCTRYVCIVVDRTE